MNDKGLVERLNKRRPTTQSYLYGEEGGGLINPDGPEAATRIETQAERIAVLTAENERLSLAVCSGVLGDLLTADEGQALADFVKSIRESKS